MAALIFGKNIRGDKPVLYKEGKFNSRNINDSSLSIENTYGELKFLSTRTFENGRQIESQVTFNREETEKLIQYLQSELASLKP